MHRERRSWRHNLSCTRWKTVTPRTGPWAEACVCIYGWECKDPCACPCPEWNFLTTCLLWWKPFKGQNLCFFAKKEGQKYKYLLGRSTLMAQVSMLWEQNSMTSVRRPGWGGSSGKQQSPRVSKMETLEKSSQHNVGTLLLPTGLLSPSPARVQLSIKYSHTHFPVHSHQGAPSVTDRCCHPTSQND